MQRMVRAWIVAASAAALCATGFAACAQDGDDWEFSVNPDRKLTAAVVRYEGGKAIVVQCLDEELRIVLVGLPVTTATARRFTATRADERTDTSIWKVEGPLVINNEQSARNVRFLRTEGEVQLRSAAGEPEPLSVSYDLPGGHANLDRVITACGYPLENERDAYVRADPDLRFVRPLRDGETGGRSGSAVERSCIILDGALQHCRADHWIEGYRERNPARQVQGLNGRRIHPDDAAASEGRVIYLDAGLLEVYVR